MASIATPPLLGLDAALQVLQLSVAALQAGLPLTQLPLTLLPDSGSTGGNMVCIWSRGKMVLIWYKGQDGVGTKVCGG